MPHNEVISFSRRVHEDKVLQDRIEALRKLPREQGLADIVKLGETAGFSFTAAELVEVDAVMDFLLKVNGDAALQSALRPIQQLDAEAAADAIVGIASRAGFSFSKQALEVATKAQVEAGPLSDEEMDRVAGGLTSYTLAVGGQLSTTSSTRWWFPTGDPA